MIVQQEGYAGMVFLDVVAGSVLVPDAVQDGLFHGTLIVGWVLLLDLLESTQGSIRAAPGLQVYRPGIVFQQDFDDPVGTRGILPTGRIDRDRAAGHQARAAATFKNIHVDKLFLATAGISADFQLTYPSLSDLAVKSALLRAASQVYLLADSSKLGYSSFASLGRISLIDTLITDNKITAAQLDALKEMKVSVL